jgi:hypothetical protein
VTDPSRPDKILRDWAAVASEARRPATPHRVVLGGGLAGVSLAGLTVAIAAVLVAFVWFGGRGPDQVGSVPLVSPSATPLATPAVTPEATPSLTPSPTPAATPTATPTAKPTATPSQVPTATPRIGKCEPSNLAIRIMQWEGAAGHRIADVELTNTGLDPCIIRSIDRPQLVDRRGTVLIDGTDPSSSTALTIASGETLTTMVDAANYCGTTPLSPISVAFVSPDGTRIVASPASAAVDPPPCNGPGQPGSVDMHPWAR